MASGQPSAEAIKKRLLTDLEDEFWESFYSVSDTLDLIKTAAEFNQTDDFESGYGSDILREALMDMRDIKLIASEMVNRLKESANSKL